MFIVSGLQKHVPFATKNRVGVMLLGLRGMENGLEDHRYWGGYRRREHAL